MFFRGRRCASRGWGLPGSSWGRRCVDAVRNRARQTQAGKPSWARHAHRSCNRDGKQSRRRRGSGRTVEAVVRHPLPGGSKRNDRPSFGDRALLRRLRFGRRTCFHPANRHVSNDPGDGRPDLRRALRIGEGDAQDRDVADLLAPIRERNASSGTCAGLPASGSAGQLIHYRGPANRARCSARDVVRRRQRDHRRLRRLPEADDGRGFFFGLGVVPGLELGVGGLSGRGRRRGLVLKDDRDRGRWGCRRRCRHGLRRGRGRRRRRRCRFLELDDVLGRGRCLGGGCARGCARVRRSRLGCRGSGSVSCGRIRRRWRFALGRRLLRLRLWRRGRRRRRLGSGRRRCCGWLFGGSCRGRRRGLLGERGLYRRTAQRRLSPYRRRRSALPPRTDSPLPPTESPHRRPDGHSFSTRSFLVRARDSAIRKAPASTGAFRSFGSASGGNKSLPRSLRVSAGVLADMSALSPPGECSSSSLVSNGIRATPSRTWFGGA